MLLILLFASAWLVASLGVGMLLGRTVRAADARPAAGRGPRISTVCQTSPPPPSEVAMRSLTTAH
ncbi:hypothetical protein [Blastococcus sp. URHD0036]|uniref:hypothetical protein n=1 Tax=Blastococcus sp. URHD0036 TaxID=1380356 RepID=UPI000497E2C4|nr:hypothetical protein [Blastococcus sp. URHD0036]